MPFEVDEVEIYFIINFILKYIPYFTLHALYISAC